MELATVQDSHIWNTVVKGAHYKTSLDFQVMHSARTDVYLDQEWLFHLGPSLRCSYQDNSLEFTHEGKKVRLQGESQVPTTPLISSVELCRATIVDDLDQVYVVTPIHSFLSAGESENNSNCLNDVFVVETVKSGLICNE